MTAQRDIDLKAYIRHIPDFPKPGILFYDISTLMRNPDAWQMAMGRLARQVAPFKPDILAAVESRGFLTAAPLADRLGCGMLMLRKKGKLPGRTVSHTYELEYGSDTLEIQEDAVSPGQRVVIMDDLLATGGTLSASAALLRKAGAEVVGASVLVELTGLGGRAKMDGIPITTLLSYED
ncbi:adenine phosphoribosyltransferase [Acetobacter sp. TBRC 12305]|uniref:Adenine phosphoribosyltransferase n=1 Tax=Acetobacter garciniae TaxID=2817435 RepID=A0A939HNB7_9PROT|nr:adenine phosphoribosyltransferase [Acetobacter garciniae]MBO1324577.1 adenine phosphoribosyltransferase [Acetobacter garciniae]MBX0344266.1 adenine phosphoribosyltransferase [Acetobacter garciniae]